MSTWTFKNGSRIEFSRLLGDEKRAEFIGTFTYFGTPCMTCGGYGGPDLCERCLALPRTDRIALLAERMFPAAKAR